MEFRAKHRYARISPTKVRLVVDLIKGRSANEALEVLSLTRKRAASFIVKVLKSAVANAGLDVNVDDLWVKDARADEGPRLKRWRPRDRGMAVPILKRTCHIALVLSDAQGVRS